MKYNYILESKSSWNSSQNVKVTWESFQSKWSTFSLHSARPESADKDRIQLEMPQSSVFTGGDYIDITEKLPIHICDRNPYLTFLTILI